jgi:hypothetical protein
MQALPAYEGVIQNPTLEGLNPRNATLGDLRKLFTREVKEFYSGAPDIIRAFKALPIEKEAILFLLYTLYVVSSGWCDLHSSVSSVSGLKPHVRFSTSRAMMSDYHAGFNFRIRKDVEARCRQLIGDRIYTESNLRLQNAEFR